MSAATDYLALEEAARALGYALVPVEAAPRQHRPAPARKTLPPAQHVQVAHVVRRGEELALSAKTRGGEWLVMGLDGRILAGRTDEGVKQGWKGEGSKLTRTPATVALFALLDDALGMTCYLCPQLVATKRVKYCDAHGRWANGLHGRLVEAAEGDSYGKSAYSGPVGRAREEYDRKVLAAARKQAAGE